MASAVELGVGYISLAASTKQFGKDYREALKELGGEADKASTKAGSSWSSKVGKLAGGAVKGLAIGVAGVGAALGGLALHGGVDRALKIEGAQAKLKGLGHDTEAVDKIMANAMASVKGTAFGLGEAATTAAGAVAAGIKPGSELETTLKSVANSAAAAGVDMGEMGTIFNKVASTGKAQNDVLAQVAERGIPIYQALGDELGVTADAVFDMASKGQIDFKTFEKAMSAASGTVAEEMGNTLPGKLDNAKAALSRLGEKVVGGVLPVLSEGVGGFTDMLDGLGPVAEKAGEWVGNAMQGAAAWIRDTLVPAVQNAAAWIRDDLAPVLRDIANWIRDNVLPVMQQWGDYIRDNLVPVISDLATWVRDDLVPAIKNAADWIVKNKDYLIALAAGAAIAAAGIGGYLLIMKGMSIVKSVTGAVKALNLAMKANVFGIIVTAVAALVAALIYFFTETETGQRIWKKFTDGLKTAWAAVSKFFSDTWSAITTFFSESWTNLKETGSASIGWLRDTIERVTNRIREIWTNIWGKIKKTASDIWTSIKDTISGAIGKVRTTISDITGKIKEKWDSIWGKIKKTGSDVWNWIKDTATSKFEDMKKSVTDTVEKLKNALSRIWGGIKSVFAKPINAVIGFINKGIIGGYNWVAGKFDMKKLPEMSKIEGYDRGGWTGPGGRLDPAGIVHADEFVVKKSSRRRFESLHPGLLDYVNRTGELPAGYAGGGRVSYQGKTFTARFVAALENARKLFGGSFHISQGGFRPRTSYSGTSHAGDAVDITSPVSNGLVAALRRSGIAAWDRTGKGNWVPHIHGVPLPGFGSGAGSAIWQAEDYLKGGDGLGGRDNGPRGGGILDALKGVGEAIKAGFTSVKEWFTAITDRITEPYRNLMSSVTGFLAPMVEGVADKLKSELTGWVKDKLGMGYAGGTSSARRGVAWVGEQGPELVAFRGGEHVYPAGTSVASGGVHQTINVDIPRDAFRDLDTFLGFFAQLGLRAQQMGA